MDMIYHLPFRDWLELDLRPGEKPMTIAEAEPESEVGGGDVSPANRARAHRN